MFPILFHLGPITLHTYGLLVAFGFLAAFSYATAEFDRLGLPVRMLDHLVLYLMLSGIVGARIFYFVFEGWDEFLAHPLSFFRIWEGGLVYFGGVVVGLLALAIYARFHELPFILLSDAFSAPLLLGHAIGRLGCFAAGCCFGKPTTSFFHVVYSNPDSLAPLNVPLYPTQIYESLGTLALFLGAWGLGKRSPKLGVITSYYLLGYGLLRFFLEFLRGDDRGTFVHGFSPAQIIALIMMGAGVVLATYVRRQKTV